jgi:putative membrane protein
MSAKAGVGGNDVSAAWNSVLSGLPVLIVHLALTTGIFIAGLALYMWVTPFHELRLVRQGNLAAGVALSGAILALVVPLSAMMANSVSVPDILLWGAVSVVLQLIAFGVVALLFRRLAQSIDRGDIAPALVLAAVQLATGLLNAAAMSG